MLKESQSCRRWWLAARVAQLHLLECSVVHKGKREKELHYFYSPRSLESLRSAWLPSRGGAWGDEQKKGFCRWWRRASRRMGIAREGIKRSRTPLPNTLFLKIAILLQFSWVQVTVLGLCGCGCLYKGGKKRKKAGEEASKGVPSPSLKVIVAES